MRFHMQKLSDQDQMDFNGSQSAGTGTSARAQLKPQRAIDGAPLIVHSHLRWDFVWQRPQQIFSRLAAYHAILFVEEPVLEEGEQRLKIDESLPNIVRVVPILSRQVGGVDAQCEASLALLRQALARHPLLVGRFDSPIQWFYSPMSAPCFLGQFGAVAVVYDCMDELANFRFAPADIAERERFLMAKADVVFTGGYQLFQSKSRYHHNVHFFGCGVDVDHNSRARSAQTQLPADVAQLPHPIFGYFGVIDERIDYELLAQLAQRFPNASVVMIGPLAKVDRAMLPSLENIHWLGQRAYDDLPAYLKAFDVCLMPFALNEATRYINPTKTLEYMAAGKPIVSTAVPDVVHNFTPVVEIGYSANEFITAVQRAFTKFDRNRAQLGIERANGATWESIVASMRSYVLNEGSRPLSGYRSHTSDFP